MLLLSIKSLVTIADMVLVQSHNTGREELTKDAAKMVDTLSLASQAAYQLNMFRVSKLPICCFINVVGRHNSTML